MSTCEDRAGLSVAPEIIDFAEATLADAGLDREKFWSGVAEIIADLTSKNAALLATRDRLQKQLDAYHRQSPGVPNPQAYREFLTEIGYLHPEPASFEITTENVAPEIAELAGPQLVVPLLNARFALNAVNARWGSLYDALYGTDAIAQEGDLAPGREYNQARGAEVIARGRKFLDQIAALSAGSHAEAQKYSVDDHGLAVALGDGTTARLASGEVFVGYTGAAESPEGVLLRHNGLHAEIVIDQQGPIGSTDQAGVQDIVLESALTTIMDLEDSVAAVDAEDKALGYWNWRGLNDGTLTETVEKGGKTFTRAMNPDRVYNTPAGDELVLSGGSVLFVRNVGHLMRTPAVRDADGAEVFEGILDAIMTTLGGLPRLQETAGSMYIVKPKMHGPEEVAFTVELFSRVEQLLGLPERTLKVGIMDEERRTSANLAACIQAASDRVVFINTGFLDRTGDEIHTSMHAGPMLPKAAIKNEPWLNAYEQRNVSIGVSCGFTSRAQIGKGMWAMPDLMHQMLEQKIGHVKSGASTAWVPSPTAATLHVLHYHQQDAFDARRGLPELAEDSVDALLSIPLAAEGSLSPETVQTEVENNVQSILGYVVRWIDQGVGCSKVPDIQDVALMEDRATLRISSQLLANWLMHDVITIDQIDEALAKYAVVVDAQNQGDATYEKLEGGTGVAYEAARRLIIEGAAQPSGYTEPLLHQLRLKKKTELAK